MFHKLFNNFSDYYLISTPVVEISVFYFSTEKLDSTPGEPFTDPYLVDTRDLNLFEPDLVHPLKPVTKSKVFFDDFIYLKS